MPDNQSEIDHKTKRNAIIVFLILLLVTFLDTPIQDPLDGTILFAIGKSLGYLFLGIILGNIYFLLQRRNRTKWQKYRVILFIALFIAVYNMHLSRHSLIQTFREGYQEGIHKSQEY